MYQSKFLLNRQKIFNPLEIQTAIASYFLHLPASQRGSFFYRLEWYKIGISVPMLVYSDTKPLMKLMPELQLLDTAPLPELPLQADSFDFSIFAVPAPDVALEGEIDEKAAKAWLQKQLVGAATITDAALGPNNCIYYQKDGTELHQQTVTIKGSLSVKSRDKLEKLRRRPLGGGVELGCGLLYLLD